MTICILRRRKLGLGSCDAIAKLSKHDVQVVRSDRPFPPNTDTVIRWGTTSNVPCRNVFNTAVAVHQVNSKREFRRILNKEGLCPKTWFNFIDLDEVIGDHGNLLTPIIARPAYHSQGRSVEVFKTIEDLNTFHNTKYGKDGVEWYYSELIPKVAEFRVAVVSGRAIWVAKKTPGNPGDVAWNVARGGRFDNVNWDNWPLKAVKVSIESFNLSELDFGGVDVMLDAVGRAYVVEINSAPSMTSPYRQECMAKAFDWMIEHGKDRIPLIEQRGGYTKFIHPAICGNAKCL